MSKLKNKSGAKKRFIFTSDRRIKMSQSNKKHNMIKKNKRQIRRQKGMVLLYKVEKKRVLKYIYC